MGAAKNSRFCALAIKHQVISVGVLAFNILTAFTASSINVLQAPANAVKISKLSKAWMKAAPQFKTSEMWMKAEPNIKVGKKLYNVFNGAYTATMSVYHIKNATYVTNEDYVLPYVVAAFSGRKVIEARARATLDELHSVGVAHCDVRAANVFVLGVVKTVILDDLQNCRELHEAPPKVACRLNDEPCPTAPAFDEYRFRVFAEKLPSI
ncbi:hypothetical protein B5M09_005589 [Aphanomyces astaci]|uniref:Protein kinase domain-containing protein n=1 Tax=Aphanomyces astaci TaxID=112090 RepID=A0A425D7K9_APHAT|nr:hypothetical protein B5M09_005589 [Aphanomyces astaci]